MQEQSLQSWSSTREELNFRSALRKSRFLIIFWYLIHSHSQSPPRTATDAWGSWSSRGQAASLYAFISYLLFLSFVVVGVRKWARREAAAAAPGEPRAWGRGSRRDYFRIYLRTGGNHCGRFQGKSPPPSSAHPGSPPASPGCPRPAPGLEGAQPRVAFPNARAVNDTPGPFRLWQTLSPLCRGRITADDTFYYAVYPIRWDVPPFASALEITERAGLGSSRRPTQTSPGGWRGRAAPLRPCGAAGSGALGAPRCEAARRLRSWSCSRACVWTWVTHGGIISQGVTEEPEQPDIAPLSVTKDEK